MPFLEHEENTREITSGETLVGSGSQAGWRLQTSDLAARHFSIGVNGDGATVKPYSAQNIVVVNGRQVALSGVRLADGDQISAGSAHFVYIEDVNKPRTASAAVAGSAAYLVDEREKRAYPLKKKTVNIGRDAASQVPIKDPSVSRFHADVRSEAGQFVLYAMGSAGTRINGQAVSAPQLLEEGDLVEIGGTTLRFTRQAPAGGIKVQSGADNDLEDASARRSTMIGERLVTGERETPGGRSNRGIIIGVIVLLVIVAIVFMFRH